LPSESFPGGVRDEEGLRAFLGVGEAGVAAVDLGDGHIVWRRDDAGRPLAATTERLFTIAKQGASLVLRRLDAATGADQGPPHALDIAPWAADLLQDPAAFAVRVSRLGEQFRFDWEARQRRTGGAPAASPAPLLQARGAVVAPAGSAPTNAPHDAAPPSPGIAPPAPDAAPAQAGVLARTQLGEREFTLKLGQADGGDRLTLEARAVDGGRPLWSAHVADLGRRRPDPPKP
jgi:hypothetical protein